MIKLLRFFCINICCFSSRFYFIFLPQWHSPPSVIKIVDVFDLYTPYNQNVHCVISSNDQYQGNGFAADVLLGRDHPRVVPIVRGVIAFAILRTWWDAATQVASQSVHWQASYGISNIFQQRPSAMLNFKNFNIWSCDRHCGPNLLLYTKFQQDWFTRSAPDAHNCQMYNAPLLGNVRCHGNRITGDMSGTWQDATT